MGFWPYVLRNYIVTGNASFSVQCVPVLPLVTSKLAEVFYVRQQFWKIIHSNKLR